MWLGDDNTMQGFDGAAGTDGQLYQWVEGIDGLGNPVGCWRVVQGPTAQAPYRRNSATFLGEIAEGQDGNMYQWVQGVDGLGSTIGFWKKIRGFVKKTMPLARMAASFIPGGSAAMMAATPLLRKVGVAGADGLGALYAAPDGAMYQVQGVDAGDDLNGFGDDPLNGLEADDELNGFGAGDELNGFGAGDDLDGFDAAEELSGFGAGDELNGFGAGEDLNGFGAGEDLNGFAAGEDMNGVDANDELNGFAADDAMNGFGDQDMMNGYVRDRGVSGIDAFVPERPRQTPAFSPAPNAPMWSPLW